MVVAMVALLTGLITEFMFTSTIDMVLATGARDELQAELNALSALRMRAIILKQQGAIKPLVGSLMGIMGGEAGASAGAGTSLSLGPVIEQIPVSCSLLNAITRAVDVDDAGVGKASAASAGARPDFFFGDCEATSKSEHGKIPINLLRQGVGANDTQVKGLLLEVLGNNALRRLFEQDDRTGQHADSPLALVNHITDWIDLDHNEQGSFGDEDRYYQYLRDPYRAKNAPMDSVAELKLVHGVNDLLFSLLEQSVTVYTSNPKIELGTASDQMVAMALLRAVKPGMATEQMMGAVGTAVAVVRQLRANPMQRVTVATLHSTLRLAAPGLDQAFDLAALKRTFNEEESTTWYTIEASGSVGRATRKIRVVFQAVEGTFSYARID